MRFTTLAGIAASLLVASVTPGLAMFDNCVVPEIDGPAGISAMALLVSAAMIAYNRARQ
jgi:hypothetical protein